MFARHRVQVLRIPHCGTHFFLLPRRHYCAQTLVNSTHAPPQSLSTTLYARCVFQEIVLPTIPKQGWIPISSISKKTNWETTYGSILGPLPEFLQNLVAVDETCKQDMIYSEQCVMRNSVMSGGSSPPPPPPPGHVGDVAMVVPPRNTTTITDTTLGFVLTTGCCRNTPPPSPIVEEGTMMTLYECSKLERQSISVIRVARGTALAWVLPRTIETLRMIKILGALREFNGEGVSARTLTYHIKKHDVSYHQVVKLAKKFPHIFFLKGGGTEDDVCLPAFMLNNNDKVVPTPGSVWDTFIKNAINPHLDSNLTVEELHNVSCYSEAPFTKGVPFPLFLTFLEDISLFPKGIVGRRKSVLLPVVQKKSFTCLLTSYLAHTLDLNDAQMKYELSVLQRSADTAGYLTEPCGRNDTWLIKPGLLQQILALVPQGEEGIPFTELCARFEDSIGLRRAVLNHAQLLQVYVSKPDDVERVRRCYGQDGSVHVGSFAHTVFLTKIIPMINFRGRVMASQMKRKLNWSEHFGPRLGTLEKFLSRFPNVRQQFITTTAKNDSIVSLRWDSSTEGDGKPSLPSPITPLTHSTTASILDVVGVYKLDKASPISAMPAHDPTQSYVEIDAVMDARKRGSWVFTKTSGNTGELHLLQKMVRIFGRGKASVQMVSHKLNIPVSSIHNLLAAYPHIIFLHNARVTWTVDLEWYNAPTPCPRFLPETVWRKFYKDKVAPALLILSTQPGQGATNKKVSIATLQTLCNWESFPYRSCLAFTDFLRGMFLEVTVSQDGMWVEKATVDYTKLIPSTGITLNSLQERLQIPCSRTQLDPLKKLPCPEAFTAFSVIAIGYTSFLLLDSQVAILYETLPPFKPMTVAALAQALQISPDDVIFIVNHYPHLIHLTSNQSEVRRNVVQLGAVFVVVPGTDPDAVYQTAVSGDKVTEDAKATWKTKFQPLYGRFKDFQKLFAFQKALVSN